MDFKNLDKEFQKLIGDLLVYFNNLDTYGLVGYGLILLSLIFMTIAIIL